jgi:hypothetical protein
MKHKHTDRNLENGHQIQYIAKNKEVVLTNTWEEPIAGLPGDGGGRESWSW